MSYQSKERLTFASYFLEPASSNHRQYEALRAYFVDGLLACEVADRFGYTPGSLRVLAHQFRQHPERPFFLASERQTKPASKRKRKRLRDAVVSLRK